MTSSTSTTLGSLIFGKSDNVILKARTYWLLVSPNLRPGTAKDIVKGGQVSCDSDGVIVKAYNFGANMGLSIVAYAMTDMKNCQLVSQGVFDKTVNSKDDIISYIQQNTPEQSRYYLIEQAQDGRVRILTGGKYAGSAAVAVKDFLTKYWFWLALVAFMLVTVLLYAML